MPASTRRQFLKTAAAAAAAPVALPSLVRGAEDRVAAEAAAKAAIAAREPWNSGRS